MVVGVCLLMRTAKLLVICFSRSVIVDKGSQVVCYIYVIVGVCLLIRVARLFAICGIWSVFAECSQVISYLW